MASDPWAEFRVQPAAPVMSDPWSEFRRGTVAPAAATAPASSLDKYQQAAIEEREALRAKGIDTGAGVARRYVQGATLNTADEILAGLTTPLEMIKRGTFNPREAYNYAKAREDLIINDARENTGVIGGAAELAGGIVTGTGAAKAGLTFAPAAGASLKARAAGSAADAAIMGGVAGLAEGNTFDERFRNAATGAAVGGVVGGAVPVAGSLLKTATSPITSNIAARINPERYASNQVARAVSESGMTPQQIAQEVADAGAAGQGMFTVADAMGNSGQRMLSTTARGPGAARTEVVEFLNNRQAGQGGRLSTVVDDALGVSGTARQSADQLTQAARNQSRPLYEAAYAKRPNWSERLQEFYDDPIAKRGLKEGVAIQRLESLASGKTFKPSDYAITNFDEAGDPIISGVPNLRTIDLIKKGWDNILDGYRDTTTGRLVLDERGRALDRVRRAFLEEVDSLNPEYAEARRLYAGPAQAKEQVGRGGQAASRGRAEDNIDQFSRLNQASRQGFRTGYADKLSEGFERSAEGVNKARGLTSDKRRAELNALSLYQGPSLPGQGSQIEKLIGRENTMFQTRHATIGNSKTAENLNDDAAMGVDPTLVGNLLSGNWSGAARGALQAGQNALSGNTPEVRQAIARMLLTTKGGAESLQGALDDAILTARQRQLLISTLGRGGSAALAVGPSAAGYRQN